MPIVRYDPPKKERNPIATFRQFFTSPIETVLRLATTKEPKELGAMYISRPVEIDTDTGQVTVEKINRKGGRDLQLVQLMNSRADDATRAIEVAFNTGQVPEIVPPGYRFVVEHAAGLKAQFPGAVDSGQEAEQPEPFQQFQGGDQHMGGFLPPGGLAGFAQMTPASKLGLTRFRGKGATGSWGRKKRKRKAKKTAGRRKKRKASTGTRKRGKRKLVKGSAAAKRYMASIRKKRGSYRRG